MSRDKTCEARGWGAYQSGIEGCHDEWFQREARIARLCMMFMQDDGGVRSVRKVASSRYRLRAPASSVCRRSLSHESVLTVSIDSTASIFMSRSPRVCSFFDPANALTNWRYNTSRLPFQISFD